MNGLKWCFKITDDNLGAGLVYIVTQSTGPSSKGYLKLIYCCKKKSITGGEDICCGES
jgi:hypothetical protein